MTLHELKEYKKRLENRISYEALPGVAGEFVLKLINEMIYMKEEKELTSTSSERLLRSLKS